MLLVHWGDCKCYQPCHSRSTLYLYWRSHCVLYCCLTNKLMMMMVVVVVFGKWRDQTFDITSQNAVQYGNYYRNMSFQWVEVWLMCLLVQLERKRTTNSTDQTQNQRKWNDVKVCSRNSAAIDRKRLLSGLLCVLVFRFMLLLYFFSLYLQDDVCKYYRAFTTHISYFCNTTFDRLTGSFETGPLPS